MAKVARTFHYDITIHQGVDEYFPMRIQAADGSVPSLAGWTGTFTIYRSPATLASLHDSQVQLAGTTSNLISVGLFDGGDFGPYNVLVTIATALTSTRKPWGNGVYVLDLIDPYGHVQYRVRGAARLEEGTKHD